MSTLRWLGTVGLVVTLGAGCGAITGEPLGGTGGNGAGGNGSGSGGAATGGHGAGGTATGGSGQGGTGGGCVCSQIYAPVCGVDGITYGNACAASCLGVAIAYQGACIGVDAGSNSCNSDSDCVFESSGCCGQTCVARTTAPPPNPIICNVACPLQVAETCGCVNHQCVTELGTGGAGGANGAGGAGGAGGASCGDLARQYADALPNAEQCAVNAKSQCLQSVSASLSPCNGNCMTYVNDATTLNAIQATWLQQGCNNVYVLCPAIACLQPAGAECVVGDGGGGHCQVLTGGITN